MIARGNMAWKLSALFAAVLALCLARLATALADNDDKGIVAGFISNALSSKTSKVSIGAVDGALSSDVTIHDIVLSDRDGAWLKIDTVKLVWSRTALLRRRLEINQLAIDKLDFLRKPAPPPPDPKAPKLDASALLPDLPLKVVVQTFALKTLNLGEPILGTKASLTISGEATLGPPSEGLDLRLEAHRLDAESKFAARLGFVPKSTELSVALDFDEPANGLIAKAANIPAQPPVKLTLQGKGPLDSFGAKLDFAAGPNIGAKGDFTLARQGPGRRLNTTLDARLANLFPALIAPALADPSNLRGDLFLADDGAISVKALHYVTASARLDVEGGVAADRRMDLRLHAGALPGAANIGKLEINADVQGPPTALKADASLDGEALRSALGEIGKTSVTFTMAPSGALSDGATRYAIAGDAAYSGLTLVDPAQQALFGAAAQLKFRAASAPEGGLNIETLRLDGATLTAAFAGEAGAKKLHGQLSLETPDLTRLAWLSPVALRGGANLDAALEGAPDQGIYSATLDAKAHDFGSDNVALSAFAGAAPSLTGAVRSLAGGGFGFDNLQLVGEHGAASIAGTASGDAVAVHAGVDIPQAKYLDPRVVGPVKLTTDFSGSLARLDVAVEASLANGRLLDRPVPRLDFTANAKDVTGQLDASAKLAGEVDAKPATGALHLARAPDGGWNLDALSFVLGSAHLDGAISLSSALLANGRIALNAARLDDLSPLTLTRLSGAIQSEIKLSALDDHQDVSINAKSAALAMGSTSVANLSADLKLADAFGRALLGGSASAARVVAGGETLTNLALTSKAGSEASDIGLKATARGLAIAAGGRLAMADKQLRLNTLTAQGAGRSIRLAKPATFAFNAPSVTVDELVLGVDSGRLSLTGSLGAKLDVNISVASLPLAIANIASPGLDLQGTATGKATLQGATSAPGGDWRIKLEGLSASPLRAAALKPLQIDASGRLGGGRTTLEATVSAPSAGTLRVTGSAPLNPSGDFQIKTTGRLDLAGANDFLGASGQRATGAAVLDADVSGTAERPRVRGSLKITGATFTDDAHGVKLTGIEGAILANGDQIEISELRAATPQGGSLSASGRVRLDPQAGYPGAFKITGQRAQLISTEIVTAVADLSLDVDGAIARSPRVSGRVDLRTMEITIPGSLSGESVPLAGTRHVDPGPTARARLALAEKQTGGAKSTPPFNATLALTIAAANHVFVRGRGIDAELSGDIKVAGMSANPRVSGGFDLRRGTLSMLGNQLTFTRGNAQFHGDAIPELDLLAQTTAADVTAYIAVTGPAAKPTFTFTSEPSLPQDEILSRILFQKPSGNLSAFQALQLANAVGSLTGRGDAFDKIRQSLGVDSLNVTTDANGGPVVGAQRTINDRLSLGVKTGARPEDNGVSLDFDLTRHLRLQGGVDASGGSTLGVGAQYEY